MNQTIIKIIKSRPINRTAANVVSKGEHYERKQRNVRRLFWENPPLTPPVPHSLLDLISSRKGSLAVVGYFSKGKLLVRCDCGTYELRQIPKWRKPSHSNFCQFCAELHKLKVLHLSFEERDEIQSKAYVVQNCEIKTSEIFAGK